MQIFGQLNDRHKIFGVLAATLALSLPIIYLLWVFFHWLGALIVFIVPLATLIYIANFDNVSIPYITPFLTRHYFKTKFRITEIHNRIGRTGILRIFRLIFNLIYLKILYFLILLFKNPEESFNETREEFQKVNRDIVVVDVRYDTIFDVEYIEKKIERGEQIDHDILVEFYQKLFDLHKRHKGRTAKISLSGLVFLVAATVITGTITSLIFNKTPNIFAATYNFSQQSWAGGGSASTATHSSNQGGWEYYSASSTGLVIGTDVKLATSSFSFTDDGTVSTSTPNNTASGGDFDNGTNASTTVSGSGSGASIKLGTTLPGDYDLLIGSDGASMAYGYENTGTVSSPTWTAKTAWDLSCAGPSRPTFADLNNDGDYDLLVGEYAGVSYGYENTGTVSSPTWAAKSAWNTPDIGTYASPAFADLDNDGDYDLLIGENSGISYGYENTGTVSSPTWAAKSAWNTPDVGIWAKPAFTDLDNDQDFDILIGNSVGVSTAYENTGTVSSSTWSAKSAWNAPDIGIYAAPAFADLNGDVTYISSGTSTSAIIDMGGTSDFTTLGYSASTSASTTIQIDIRAGNTATPDGSWTSWQTNISNGGSITALNGNRYIQYRAILSTTDTAYSPALNSLTINNSLYTTSANLTSSIYDSGDAANLVIALAWSETGTTTNETIKFQVRSASSSAGISSAAWCGYTEVSTSTCAGTGYFTSTSSNVTVASTHPLRNGANDRFFQYKIFLASSGGTTPTADNVLMTYVVNAPPEVQNFTATQGSDGNVAISYEVRDTDSASGSVTPGYITPSFEYWNGSSWTAATTFAAGDLTNKAVNTVSTTTYTAYTATWYPNTDFDAQYLNSAFKMRITINDNEAANNTVQLASATTTLDTKNPTLGAVPVKVIATTTSASVTLSATDDTSLQVKVSLNSDLSGASWVPYESATTTTLATDPDVVYAQFKDAYGNTSAIQSATTPETPTSLIIQDTSNVSANEYSLFVAWKMVALPSPGFGRYHILRSTSTVASTFSVIASSTDRAVNYYRDSTISSSTTYYYKIITEDANGNVSYFSSSVNGSADGTQGPGEGGGGTDVIAPTISNVQVTATTTQTATIVWDTNELSNSTIGYSVTPGSYATEVGNSTMADSSSGVGRHQVVLTNLSASTTYYFRAKSTDPAGNTGTNDNSSAGYTFTTKPGAVISGVTQNEIQNTKATVVWTTDITADSIVVFSTNSNLSAPQTVQGSPNLVTSHSVNLTGLTANTRYYYYVKSTDSENNIATDNNAGNYYTFLTTQDTAAPTITFTPSSNITNVGTSSVSITWTTDQPATSTLAYGTTSGGPYGSRSDINNYNYNHSVNLAGLSASTTYYFQLVATDENGNSTTTNNGGAGYSFTTSALPDNTAPVISLVATSTTISSATVTWTTDENASSFVQYATSTASFETDYIEKGRSATTTSHSVTLTGLSENVTYYFRARSTDVDGNARTDNNSGNYYSFTTTRDSTAPAFSSIAASPVTDTSAVITWTTNERATSQITFGTAAGTYSSSTAINTNLNLTHSITLSGLAQSTVYYYKVISTDASSNTGTSTEQSFTTSETLSTESQVLAREAAVRSNASGGGMLIIDKNDKVAPVISNIQIQDIKSDSAVITWNTDEESDSFVEYGIGSFDDTSGRYENTRAHTVNLKKLFPESSYVFRVLGKDASGNLAQSEQMQFMTLSIMEDVNSADGAQDGNSENALMSAVNKTIDMMYKIASQVSLSTMQSALITQQNSIEDLASMIPGPLMSGEPRVELTPTTAIISWHTDKESNSLVALVKEGEYDGTAANPYKQVLGLPKDSTKDHVVILYDLIPDTGYHYQLRSETSIGTNTKSRDFIFRTPKEALEIGGYTVEKVSSEKAIFKWMTNVETDSEIKYIPYRNNMLAVDESKTARDKAFTSIHDMTISEFEAGTVYQIEISGKDAGGSIASKVIPTFFTSEEDLPPTISQVQTNLAISPGKDSKIQAVISWMTDEPSTSRVFYQKGFAASGTDLAEKTSIDPNFTKKHAIVITKFDPGAIYTFKVESIDSGGNMTLSKTYTILAPKQRETVFQVIMKNFESMFGWVGNMKQ